MFSKIDKKILIIALIIFVIVLGVGILVYKNFKDNKPNIENSLGGANTVNENEQNQTQENNNLPQIQAEIKTEGNTGIGSLTVCLDQCGNGVCQKSDTNCEKNDGSNCICAETPQECPQDCK